MQTDDLEQARLALEMRMGELAALLDHVAEALTCYPEEIRIAGDGNQPSSGDPKGSVVLQANAWPSIQEIEQLLANWRALRGTTARL